MQAPAAGTRLQHGRAHIRMLRLPALQHRPGVRRWGAPSPQQQPAQPLAPASRPRLVVAASSASFAAPSPGSSPQQQQQQQPGPLSGVPLWAKLLGTAAALAAWCAVTSAMRASAPFATVSLALGGSSEGLRVAVRSAWAGLAAGCLHTLAGADHLAALTPLTIGRSHFKASLMGALWGFGHSTGQLILGLLMVLLKDRFQQLVPALSKWGGATVGLTLLAIGVLGIYESFFEEHHEDHYHGHGEETAEFEVGPDGVLVAKPKAAAKKGGFGKLATFATGIVYGLQPDALFVIVPALALPTKIAAVAYIVMFVLGTCAAMGSYTAVIGATSAAIKKTNSGLTQKLSGIASFVAIAIGATILAPSLGFELPFSFGGGH